MPRLEDRKPDGSPKTGHMWDVLNHINLCETVGETTYQHLSTSINYILQDFRRISCIDSIKHPCLPNPCQSYPKAKETPEAPKKHDKEILKKMGDLNFLCAIASGC